MARGKKTDAEIKAKVIESKINNLSKSSRDIANELGWIVSNDTVCDILNKDLPQVATESQHIASLIDRNNNLQSLADSYLAELIVSKDEKVTAGHLVSLRESAFKQNQLLTGKPTENKSVNFTADMTDEELLDFLNKSIV